LGRLRNANGSGCVHGDIANGEHERVPQEWAEIVRVEHARQFEHFLRVGEHDSVNAAGEQHALRDQLKVLGYEVLAEPDNASGIKVAETFSPSVIITDTIPTDREAFAALREIRVNHPHTPIIVAGEASSVETALRAIQDEGAYHYFNKPVEVEKLTPVLERAVELAEARRQNDLLRRELRGRGAFGELVG